MYVFAVPGVESLLTRRMSVPPQVVITTYHTLNLDFNIPQDMDSGEELDWLRDHG